jgi:putative phosphoribosyl transferase
MTVAPLFRDRADAGRALARKLVSLRGSSPVVVALPRGGVPVAVEIADALGAPLDVCVVLELGLPGRPEIGMGAIAEGGETFVDHEMADRAHVAPGDLERLAETRLAEARVRARRYRGGAAPLDLRGRTVIIVDDGLATAGMLRVALRALRVRGAHELVIAVPVAEGETLAEITGSCDDVVCVADEDLGAVSFFYVDFTGVPDAAVATLLGGHREGHAVPA